MIIFAVMIVIISACSNNPPTSIPTPNHTATPNEVLVTPDATRMNRDLPATWTPTFTPTITDTPTATPTFTVTPSLTPINKDLLCQDFRASLALIDGQTFSEDDTISLSYGIGSDYHYAFVGVILSHEDVEGIISDVMPGGGDYTSTFIVRDFPTSGEWSYRTGVFLIDGDELLCRQDGTFMIEEGAIRVEQPNTIPTAMPVPSVTPEPEPTTVQCYLLCPR